MKNSQRARHDSIKRVINCVTNPTNAAKVALIPDYPAEEAKLIAKEQQITNAGAKQAADTSGAIADNKSAKYEMAKNVIKFARRGAVKARNAGNHTLAEQLAHHVNYIFKASKGLAIQHALDIRNALNNNLGIITNVTPADITTIDATITAFQDVETDPVSLIEQKKAGGTDLIPGFLNDADLIIENIYDLIYSYYFDTDPAFVDEVKLAMQIINTGVHHTGLIIICVDAAPAQDAESNILQGVQMKIVELDYIATSDIQGLCGIAKVKPGTYHIEFSKDGYATQTHVITLTRGKMLENEVIMARA